MATLGNDNGESKACQRDPTVDISDIEETQPFDSQFSPSSLYGEEFDVWNAEKLSHLQNTVPCDNDSQAEEESEAQSMDFGCETQPMDFGCETQPMEFGCETQPMEFGCETQLMEFGCETQSMEFGCETQLMDPEYETDVLNYAGETQVMNNDGVSQALDDPDCFETQLLENLEDEIASDSDDEGTDTTEVFDDSDELSDGESWKEAKIMSLEGEKIQHTSSCNNDEGEMFEVSEALINERKTSGFNVSTPTPAEQGITGSKHARFTSVRTRSFRASGLAARSTSLEETCTESCSVLTNCHSVGQETVNSNRLEPEVGDEVHKLHDLGGCNDNTTPLRNGSKIARKLFTEDSSAESKEYPHATDANDRGCDVYQSPDCDSLAGLSYVDSQEPGEASQANALNFVEMFVNDNCFAFDHEIHRGKSTGGKTMLTSSVKGPNSLAKKVNERIRIGETGFFDWDDKCEDERGGDIFCRKKEEFFGGGSHTVGFHTLSQVTKGRGRGKCRDTKEHCTDHGRRIVHTDSNQKLQSFGETERKAKSAGMDFECFITDTSREQLEKNSARTDAPPMPDVGFDTQDAAEAMEALFYGEGLVNHDTNDLHQDIQPNSNVCEESFLKNKEVLSAENVCLSGSRVVTVKSKKRQKAGTNLSAEPSVLSKKRRKNVLEDSTVELMVTKKKRIRPNSKADFVTNSNESKKKNPSKNTERKKGEAWKGCRFNKPNRLSGHNTVKKQQLHDKLAGFSPIACRTRHSMEVKQMRSAEKEATACGANRNQLTKVSWSLKGKESTFKVGSNQSSIQDQSQAKFTATDGGLLASSYPRRRRSRRNLSGQVNEADKFGAQPKYLGRPQDVEYFASGLQRSQINGENTCVDLTIGRITGSSQLAQTVTPSVSKDQKSKIPNQREQNLDKQDAGDAAELGNISGTNGKLTPTTLGGTETVNQSEKKLVQDSSPFAERTKTNVRLGSTPLGKGRPLDSACSTPVNCMTAVNVVSPVCMGDEYFKQSCRKNLLRSGLMKEINSLTATEPKAVLVSKDTRKRRDLANVRVMFSHHLGGDLIKQQKKILARIGVSAASSMIEATHFVADEFVRTRNMLEAIASGKPVVTHLWLESVGQVNIHIDEEGYILRDVKKEKEFGFSMPVSLARARQFPLLLGRRVFTTPNTKPSKETVSSLVKVVHGKAMERVGRSAMKDDKVPDDLLILSCEEDYDMCVPFLEKGASVYSSELLLNGIVTQKLEYERHRLFTENVKRTRSSIWIRKDSGKFVSVSSNK